MAQITLKGNSNFRDLYFDENRSGIAIMRKLEKGSWGYCGTITKSDIPRLIEFLQKVKEE